MVDFIKTNGLSGASLRTLAEAVGTSDRMLLYYFKDKTDIMVTVLEQFVGDLTQALTDVVPMGARLPSDALFMKIVDLSQAEDLRPYMALRLEITANALTGQTPYPEISNNMSDAFITWLDDRLQVANMDARRAQAVMLLAMIDGAFQVSISTDEATFTQARNSMAMALRGMC